jgi:hypothetical protein
MKIYSLGVQDVGARESKKRPKMLWGLRISKTRFTLSAYRTRRDEDWCLYFILGQEAIFDDSWRKYEKLEKLTEALKE